VAKFKTAEELGAEQREISVAEFFEKNRHLLGFDNPAKALLIVVKECVDNSLDACCDAGILPEIYVEIKEPAENFKLLSDGEEVGKLIKIEGEFELIIEHEILKPTEKYEKKNGFVYVFEHNKAKYKLYQIKKNDKEMLKIMRGRAELKLVKISSNRFLIIVEDNGPGIVPEQVPRVFGKLLYGSKFYKLRQNRGQQGIGVSAACLYAQLTTGKPITILTRTAQNKPVHAFRLRIDTAKNEPIVVEHKNLKNGFGQHGTRIELEIEGKYIQRYHSVEEYLKQTAITNPYAHIVYTTPEKQRIEFKRTANELPVQPAIIKPHPLGVELGAFERMTKLTESRTLAGFLANEFCRIGQGTAGQLCKLSGIGQKTRPSELDHKQIDRLWRTMQTFSFTKPPTTCLSPIGEKEFENGLKKEYKVDFVAVVSRPPCVYRGMPFLIEVAICYGGELPQNEPANIMRFANRVPLLYQAASCAIMKSLQRIEWRNYGLDRSGSMPAGPAIIAVHMASVWIPYTSESKEAIDPYPIIVKEIKLALQDCARKLGHYVSGRKRVYAAQQRQSLFEKYIPEVAEAISKLAETPKERIKEGLEKILKEGKIVVETDKDKE